MTYIPDRITKEYFAEQKRCEKTFEKVLGRWSRMTEKEKQERIRKVKNGIEDQ